MWRKRGLYPSLLRSTEYEEWPRGRIVYDMLSTALPSVFRVSEKPADVQAAGQAPRTVHSAADTKCLHKEPCRGSLACNVPGTCPAFFGCQYTQPQGGSA